MPRLCRLAAAVLLTLGVRATPAAEWSQFRGPGGLGVSSETDVPTEWSSTKNIVWRARLPGPGSSSPVTAGGRVFVTCYSGYAVDTAHPGKQEDLRRHILCLDRRSGKVLW